MLTNTLIAAIFVGYRQKYNDYNLNKTTTTIID